MSLNLSASLVVNHINVGLIHGIALLCQRRVVSVLQLGVLIPILIEDEQLLHPAPIDRSVVRT